MANNAYTKFIDFFDKHNLYNEKAFKYLRENSILFDFREEEKRDEIGYHYIKDEKGKPSDIILCVPFIEDDITILMNIAMYTHGLQLYYNTNTNNKDIPLLMERLFVEENPTFELKKYLKDLNERRLNSNSELTKEYQESLIFQEKTLKKENVNKKIKKLTKQTLQ